VRPETSPDDVGGMYAAQGILTARGGMTSHAAVVGRGMGKCCVVGCKEILVDEEHGEFRVGTVHVKHGDIITLNGNTGEVILGAAKLVVPELSGNFASIMKWVDQHRRLGVRANAHTPVDPKRPVRPAPLHGRAAPSTCSSLGTLALHVKRQISDREARKSASTSSSRSRSLISTDQGNEGYGGHHLHLDPPLHEFCRNPRGG
jgi:phosphohistidine swiveling domain-containing protein